MSPSASAFSFDVTQVISAAVRMSMGPSHASTIDTQSFSVTMWNWSSTSVRDVRDRSPAGCPTPGGSVSMMVTADEHVLWVVASPVVANDTGVVPGLKHDSLGDTRNELQRSEAVASCWTNVHLGTRSEPESGGAQLTVTGAGQVRVGGLLQSPMETTAWQVSVSEPSVTVSVTGVANGPAEDEIPAV
jgi:hypothetical protein